MTCACERPAPAFVRRSVVGLVGLLCAGSAQAASTDDGAPPEATPYRPTVSTPAQLSAPRWLEGEFGGLQARDSRADGGLDRRSSIPYTLKYAFSDDWGVRVDGEALVHEHDAQGVRETGFGDTSLVLKRRFGVDPVSTFGLEAGVLFPTGRKALESGSGKADYTVNGIYSSDLGEWHTDVNLVGTRLGARDTGASRYQKLGAIAVSHPLYGRLSAAGELSGTHQHGAASTSQVLGALSYAVRRDIVVDVGAAHGLNRASATWQAFSGVTIVIGRID